MLYNPDMYVGGIFILVSPLILAMFAWLLQRGKKNALDQQIQRNSLPVPILIVALLFLDIILVIPVRFTILQIHEWGHGIIDLILAPHSQITVNMIIGYTSCNASIPIEADIVMDLSGIIFAFFLLVIVLFIVLPRVRSEHKELRIFLWIIALGAMDLSTRNPIGADIAPSLGIYSDSTMLADLIKDNAGGNLAFNPATLLSIIGIAATIPFVLYIFKGLKKDVYALFNDNWPSQHRIFDYALPGLFMFSAWLLGQFTGLLSWALNGAMLSPVSNKSSLVTILFRGFIVIFPGFLVLANNIIFQHHDKVIYRFCINLIVFTSVSFLFLMLFPSVSFNT
jgi:hypothetical protein